MIAHQSNDCVEDIARNLFRKLLAPKITNDNCQVHLSIIKTLMQTFRFASKRYS